MSALLKKFSRFTFSNTPKALADCVKKIKPSGYFYVYLYYKVDHRGIIFKGLLKAAGILRYFISRLPATLKKIVCDILAVLVYMPFVLFGRLLKKLKLPGLAKKIPLHGYQDKSFFVIRNDSLDRFGTILEQRFSKDEVRQMMEDAGLESIIISANEPWWHAVGRKK